MSSWLTCSAECVGVYLVPTPWFYIYFAKKLKDAGVAHQPTYGQVALNQFVTLPVLVIIGVVR